MRNLLIDDYPLMVSPLLAKEIGLNEAIVLQQIHYWVQKQINFEDGRYWVYNSYEEWMKQFPFWSLSTVKRIFRSLEDSELILSNNFNKLRIDKTKWYSVNYDKIKELPLR